MNHIHSKAERRFEINNYLTFLIFTCFRNLRNNEIMILKNGTFSGLTNLRAL